MKSQEPENRDCLDAVLHEWSLETSLPARFQEQVWQRIARAQARPDATPWGGLLRLVAVVLPRPKVALAYVTTLLVLGVAAGSWAAQLKASHLQANLGLRYVQSIDPYRASELRP